MGPAEYRTAVRASRRWAVAFMVVAGVLAAAAGVALVWVTAGDQPPPAPVAPVEVGCVDAADILVATVHTDWPTVAEVVTQAQAAANYLVLNCPDVADPTGIRDL